jgi:hypothetical protein
MMKQVQPMRQMRRNMKTNGPQHEDFRQQVKKLELKAEHYARGMLFAQTLQVVGTLLDESAIYT